CTIRQSLSIGKSDERFASRPRHENPAALRYASGFELTLPSRFSPSSALALTLAFITVAFCAPPTLPAERGVGVGRDVDVTGDFDGDGIFDSATLRDGRIALSLSERQTRFSYARSPPRS